MTLKTIDIGEIHLTIKINTEFARIIIGNFQKTVSETRFQTQDGELFGVGMDGSHIGLASFKLKLSELNHYEDKKNGEVGVNFEDLNKLLMKCIKLIKTKRNKKKNTIIKDGLNEEIEMIFGEKGVIINAKKMRLHLDSINVETEKINLNSLNNMEYVVKATMNIGELRDILRAASIFSEVILVKYNAKEKMLNFSTEGSVGDMEYEVSDGLEIIDRQYTGLDNIVNSYEIQLFDDKLKFLPKKDNIELYFKHEAPVKIYYKLGEQSELRTFLAPRIGEEKEEENTN